MTSSWTTTPASPNPMKPSLVERAMKRECREGASPDVYVIEGNSSLGDHYPQYLVRFGEGYENGVTCDCLNPSRQGSQYRRTCSHITRAMIFREENGPWGGENGQGGDDTESPDLARNAEVEDLVEAEGEEEEVRGSAETETPLAPPEEEPESPTPTIVHVELPKENGLWDVEDDALWEILEDPDFLPFPHDVKVNSQDPPLPDKFKEYRPDQWRAIMEIEAALEEGYKVVFVSAPTGSGKTLIAESVRRLRGTRAIYTCTTKTLQDQILKEFTYSKVLKGRSNYRTHDQPDNPELTTLECTKEKKTLPACQNCPGWSGGDSWKTQGRGSGVDPLDGVNEILHCNWCHPVSKCPYESAKFDAAHARLAVLNTAYFLAETNYVRNSLFRGRSLVLIDEADLLEEELMRFIEVSITARDRKLLGVGLPEKKTVDESWVVWIVDELIPAIKAKLKSVDLSPDLFGQPDIKEIRKKNKLIRLLRKVATLVQEVEDEETGEKEFILNRDWVYTGYEKDWKTGEYPPDDKVNVTFKPIQVREYAPDFLWNKAQQFVLLSATLISPAQMAYDLGLDDDEWTVVEVPSSFPVLQRPIVPRTVTNVVNKKMDEAIPMLISEAAAIMEEHPEDRILIHSVSYQLTKELFFDLRKRSDFTGRLVTYLNAGERERALRDYLHRPNGVLIAPSFDRGVDLPADDCRVVVVAKVPYLSVGDKQVSARLYGTGKAGKTWYAVQAIRTLCQMTGRGMRSAEDSCRTYILDKQFVELYNRNRKLFPGWWAEAIVWDENDPKWRGMA